MSTKKTAASNKGRNLKLEVSKLQAKKRKLIADRQELPKENREKRKAMQAQIDAVVTEINQIMQFVLISAIKDGRLRTSGLCGKDTAHAKTWRATGAM